MVQAVCLNQARPPLVDKVEAEAAAFPAPSTSTFQVLLGWITSAISLEIIQANHWSYLE